MKRCVVLIFIITFCLGVGVEAQALPEVPRISAYEAYNIYKSGKAIIVHAGGEAYEKRHIVGALNVDGDGVAHKGKPLPNFPKRGVEIIIYCYWLGEADSAVLALYMIQRGYENVKVVDGGGKGGGTAMEKHFDYYRGGKAISPMTGKTIIIK